MAFLRKLLINKDFGTFVDAVLASGIIPEYYIKLNNINMIYTDDSRNWSVSFGIYTSAAARNEDPKNPLLLSCISMPEQPIPTEIDIRAVVYAYCKSLPSFSNVKDA